MTNSNIVNMRQSGITAEPKTLFGIGISILLLALFVVLYVQFDAVSIYNQLYGTISSLATIITYSVGLVLPLIAFARFMFNSDAGRYVSPLSGKFVASSFAFVVAIILVITWYFIGIPILQSQITFGLYGLLAPSLGGIFTYIGAWVLTFAVIVPAMILLAMPKPGMVFRSVTRR